METRVLAVYEIIYGRNQQGIAVPRVRIDGQVYPLLVGSGVPVTRQAKLEILSGMHGPTLRAYALACSAMDQPLLLRARMLDGTGQYVLAYGLPDPIPEPATVAEQVFMPDPVAIAV
jgi:hypothetical protein